MNRPLVYLACPYSDSSPAVRRRRFRAANIAAAVLMRQGVKLFSPISHTHPIAEAGQLPKGWKYWEAYDRAALSCCCRLVVLKIDGWRESRRVVAEIKIATRMGIEVQFVDPADFGLQASGIPVRAPAPVEAAAS